MALNGRRHLLIAFIALLLAAGAARGQDEPPQTTQLWFDYDPTWLLSKRWTLDVDIATRAIISGQPLWQIRLQPTLQFSPWKWMDLTGGVWVIYSRQAEAFDRFETRPTVGIRHKVDIWRGVRLSNYFRVELRIQRNLDTSQTLTARRLRNRIQVMAPINHRSLSQDNTWHIFADAEFFRQRDPNVDDGFNSRQRYRAGIGWRKDSARTYQFFYGFERSRNLINEPFSSDNIFSFSLIQTFK
ncbi:MAG: DUF2490 domain-containing protein [Blastocatellia bacterium]